MREDARLDARAIGLAILAMAIVGTSYTAAKVALHDLPAFGTLLLPLLVPAERLTLRRWLGIGVAGAS